jgi:plastocyanin
MTGKFQIARLIVPATLLFAACGGGEKKTETADAPPPPSAAAQPASGFGENLTPDAGGRIITVQMLTDDQGNNRFDPAEIEAHRGDVVRFTLKTGVHNVHFLPDSNTVKEGLPPASQLLQLPGQTLDLKVTLPEGKYYLQCDPHAALGMKAKLEVEAKEN